VRTGEGQDMSGCVRPGKVKVRLGQNNVMSCLGQGRSGQSRSG